MKPISRKLVTSTNFFRILFWKFLSVSRPVCKVILKDAERLGKSKGSMGFTIYLYRDLWWYTLEHKFWQYTLMVSNPSATSLLLPTDHVLHTTGCFQRNKVTFFPTATASFSSPSPDWLTANKWHPTNNINYLTNIKLKGSRVVSIYCKKNRGSGLFLKQLFSLLRTGVFETTSFKNKGCRIRPSAISYPLTVSFNELYAAQM